MTLNLTSPLSFPQGGKLNETTRAALLTWPFDLSLGIGSLWSALAVKLANTPGLEALTAIYYQQAPPGYVFPWLSINPLSELNIPDTSVGLNNRASVQFSIFSSGDVDSEKLGLIAYNALQPLQRNAQGQSRLRTLMTWKNGYEQGAVAGGIRRIQQPARSIGNVNVWAFHFDYQFMIGRRR